MRKLESERGGGVADEQGVSAHDGRRDCRDVVRVEGLGGGAAGLHVKKGDNVHLERGW